MNCSIHPDACQRLLANSSMIRIIFSQPVSEFSAKAQFPQKNGLRLHKINYEEKRPVSTRHTRSTYPAWSVFRDRILCRYNGEEAIA